jgi:hypothetical protein
MCHIYGYQLLAFFWGLAYCCYTQDSSDGKHLEELEKSHVTACEQTVDGTRYMPF